MCSIRIFAKNMGDPNYERTIMVHDIYIHCNILCVANMSISYIAVFGLKF